jgi:preprotein translocase subunit SecB
MVKPAEPDIYNKYVRSLELENVFLEKLKVELLGADSSVETNLEIKLEDKARKINLANNKLKILHKYTVLFNREGKDETRFKFDCTFSVIYRASSDMSSAIWEVFKNRNVYLITWPYFRELFQNMLYRFNLPPITLPARKT